MPCGQYSFLENWNAAKAIKDRKHLGVKSLIDLPLTAQCYNSTLEIEHIKFTSRKGAAIESSIVNIWWMLFAG